MRARSCVCLTDADSRHLGPSTNNGSASLFGIKPVAVARLYFEDDSSRRSAGKLLSRDKARWIAVRIMKLPELLRRAGSFVCQRRFPRPASLASCPQRQQHSRRSRLSAHNTRHRMDVRRIGRFKAGFQVRGRLFRDHALVVTDRFCQNDAALQPDRSFAPQLRERKIASRAASSLVSSASRLTSSDIDR